MGETKGRPSRWAYAVAALIPLLGCLVTMALVYSWFPGLPGTFESRMNVDDLTQVVVPGSEDITFAERGAYAVYYEYRSVVDDVVYTSGRTPPALDCTLTSKTSGADIGVAPDYVPTNTYSTKDRERVGVLMGSITVDQPGTYTFSCRHAHGGSAPEVVLAVGPNFVWEFLGIAARTIVTAVAGFAVLIGSGTLAAVILIVVAVKRRSGSAATLAACLLLAGLIITGSGCAPTRPAPAEPRHCTVFTVSQRDRVFFAGNDDYINRDSTYWVDPGSDRRYGAIYFGQRANVQQGFNEKGLAYDSNGLPEVPVTSHAGRWPVSGGHSSCFIQILRECATVEEVITWVREHRWHEAMHYQMHFADATGDAVVISAGPDGRVAFTRKRDGDGFLVSTNFNLANFSNGSYPCWRYARAERMLSELVEASQSQLTVEDAAAVAEAVHVQSPSGWTLYSVVADLPQRLVYIYYMFQYGAPVVLSIDEELAQRRPSCSVSALFPEETQRRADQAYEHLMARTARCDLVGFAWAGLVALSVVGLLVVSAWQRGALALWAPVVAVLGPLGLLSRLLVWRARKRGYRSRALVETMGDLPAYVVGLVAALLTIILVPRITENRLLQLLAFYGIPLVIAVFLLPALLAWATRSGYPHTVSRRLPAVLVCTNLALAGLLAVGLPLAQWELNICGLSTWIVLAWWIIAVVGAFAGGLLLYAYHAWAVRRGFAAWSALLRRTDRSDDGPTAVTSPPWRRLWVWILLSFVVLAAGLATGIWGLMLAGGAG